MIKLIHVKYFVAVADMGSLTAVAENLGVSQPAVSYAIKEFETELGLLLFFRKNKRFELTPDGKKVYAIVNPALRKLNASLKSVENYAGSKSVLRVLTPEGPGSIEVARFLEKFGKDHPEFKFNLREVGCQTAKEEILAGNADLALQVYPNNFNCADLERIDFSHRGLNYVVSKNNKNADKESITLEEIGTSPLALFYEGSFLYGQITAAFERVGVTPNVILSSHQFATIAEIVGYGMAGTIVCPEEFVSDMEGFKIIPITNSAIDIVKGAFYVKGLELPEGARLLLEYMRSKAHPSDYVG
ncbi:MAG: LysR family transcriptional regulator [Bacilli bacterium]|nr:LysR family transcriptional regulator [Bacilli bacterium]